MKKILFDLTEITERTLYMSIPQYKMRLLNNFTEEECDNTTLLVCRDGEDFIKKKYPRFKLLVIDLHSGLLNRIPFVRYFYSCFNYKKVVNHSGCDVIFIASDVPHYSMGSLKIRKVNVIHDIKTLRGTSLKRKILRYVDLLVSYMNADVLIAISNYTKKDVLQHFPIKGGKIEVIYNSVNVIPNIEKVSYDLPEHYILWVNSINSNKNVMTFLKAYNELKNVRHEIVLVSEKTPYWFDVCLPFIKKNGFEDKVHVLSNVSDAQLRYLYEHADLFVTSSIREGFGYTPIEAAIYKCPVISSKCEALGDTTQDMVFYYEPPFDAYALKEKILYVLNNRPSNQTLTEISNFFKAKYDIDLQKKKILKVLNV